MRYQVSLWDPTVIAMPVLYCVRHGETDFNAEARLQGRRDTELNAHGKEQAAESAGLLRELFARDRHEPSDLAYVASPLKRARETMEIVRAGLGLDPKDYAVDDRLMEISYGAWEGLTLPEIAARMPGMLAERERDKWDFAPPGGESYRELAERVAEWYGELRRDTVVAAHGGGVRVLMALFNVVPREEAVHARIAQGVVYVFADGTMKRYPREKQSGRTCIQPLGKIRRSREIRSRRRCPNTRPAHMSITSTSSWPSSSSP